MAKPSVNDPRWAVELNKKPNTFNNRKAKMKQKTLKNFNGEIYSLDEYKKKANKESKKFRDLRKQKRSRNWF